ncbi:hypothetical protein R4576_18105 [Acinetobacter baumannii]|nr:hypothetical protein [Acinetobacter baumannii]
MLNELDKFRESLEKENLYTFSISSSSRKTIVFVEESTTFAKILLFIILLGLIFNYFFDEFWGYEYIYYSLFILAICFLFSLYKIYIKNKEVGKEYYDFLLNNRDERLKNTAKNIIDRNEKIVFFDLHFISRAVETFCVEEISSYFEDEKRLGNSPEREVRFNEVQVLLDNTWDLKKLLRKVFLWRLVWL